MPTSAISSARRSRIISATGTVTAVESRATAMRHDPSSFDLILTDYNLPDACGMDLLDELRALCTTPRDHGHR